MPSFVKTFLTVGQVTFSQGMTRRPRSSLPTVAIIYSPTGAVISAEFSRAPQRLSTKIRQKTKPSTPYEIHTTDTKWRRRFSCLMMLLTGFASGGDLHSPYKSVMTYGDSYRAMLHNINTLTRMAAAAFKPSPPPSARPMRSETPFP